MSREGTCDTKSLKKLLNVTIGKGSGETDFCNENYTVSLNSAGIE